MKTINILKDSAFSIRKKPKAFAKVFAFDFLFILSLLFVSTFFLLSISDKIIMISEIMKDIKPEDVASGNFDYTQYDAMKTEIGIMSMDLVRAFFFLFIIIFLTYMVFEGFALKKAYESSAKIKAGFFKRFILINMILFALSIALIQLFSGVLSANALSLSSMILKPIWQTLIIFVFLLLKYIVFSSYTIINRENKGFLLDSLKLSYKNARLILPIFLISVLMILCVYYISYAFSKTFVFGALFTILIITPLVLTYIKSMIIETSKLEYKKKN